MSMTHVQLRAMDAYFRAANYLTVGQIYLQHNPLLREPLRHEHIKSACSVTGGPRRGSA